MSVMLVTSAYHQQQQHHYQHHPELDQQHLKQQQLVRSSTASLHSYQVQPPLVRQSTDSLRCYRSPLVRASTTSLRSYRIQPPQPSISVISLSPQPPSNPSLPTGKAMRYYRLWIYTCNAVLLMSVLGFCVVAAKVLVFEPKRQLVPGMSLTQPSFVYAYLTLSFQSGLLQLIGCLGAQRLNERLLNVYWLLMLLLLVGDGLVGLLWVYRFEWIVAELRPYLKARLANQYNVDGEFTQLWDNVQREMHCCGVEGTHDFRTDNNTVDHEQPGWDSVQGSQPPPTTTLPDSCCFGQASQAAASPVIAAALRNLRNFQTTSTSTTPQPSTPPLQITTAATNAHMRPGSGARCESGSSFHTVGCEERLLAWLRHTADILFVLGYCVIAFLKLCFLGILRYEIREMIQKIKMLQGELRPAEVDDPSADTKPSLTVQTSFNKHEHNNGRILQADGGHIGGVRRGDQSLQTTPLHHGGRSHLTTLMSNDVDSDTNSHCALIIPEDMPAIPAKQTIPSNNDNNNYELQEFLLTRHRTQI
ncbi:uncharacterized protein LOC111045954 [Nilaparvata lugens]|uniref:uncharacterized protein LOC111045954 n=1 Tax=Nilaparvata lugens TaxID=108931 RepID=UPI00193CA41E|nr:uncharacterized protein LOC111045954 [Nilaparvata lugens]XP_039295712.1 uncharacterized protein LOC111045954 [Nilaparvata lugens]